MFQILSTVFPSSVRLGFTHSQTRDPITPRPAATRNDADQPKRAATNGVRDGATTPPNCPIIFITPETVPAEGPAMSAVTDQKELWERYKAPAPAASTMLASRASATSVPSG